MSDPPFDGPVRWEVPPMSEFTLNPETEGDVWMQCRRCLETWQVCTLGEGVERWDEHTCIPRQDSRLR